MIFLLVFSEVLVQNCYQNVLLMARILIACPRSVGIIDINVVAMRRRNTCRFLLWLP